jgi:hypothetical protein
MLQLISLPQLLKPDCDSVLLQEHIEKLNTAVSKFTLQISFLFYTAAMLARSGQV